MKSFIIILLFLLFSEMVRGNGSPINSSEIYGTGNIVMMKKKAISLDEEILTVEIDGDYANVFVQYKFTNRGFADKVSYGFPIDCYYGDSDGQTTSETLLDFVIEDNTGILKRIKVTEPRTDDKLSRGEKFRDWLVTELTFHEDEVKTVRVRYKVKNNLDDWVYTKSFRPEFSNRTFSYLLSPSQNWGDGVVKKCRIKIDATKVLQKNGIVKSIEPVGYVNQDGVLTWNLNNFDLKTAGDIEIVYDNSAAAMTEYVAAERVESHYITAVRASSVLKTDKINRFSYEPKNVFDNDLATAWVEGVDGDGKGEWIEIDLNEEVGLTAIGIVNGYTKREAIYLANNRIKKIQLEMESTNGEKKITQIDLDQKQFNELNKDVVAPFINWLADYGDGFGGVKRIRLTILEVYPGTKYNDSCISEIYLLGWSH